MPHLPGSIRHGLLMARVGEILYYIWDPIGIATIPQARDEYDGYVALIVQMLQEGKTKEQLAQHLYRIEGERMGLTVGSRPSDHVEEVAETLIAHYETLEREHN